jgi:muconate cycloisomerase
MLALLFGLELNLAGKLAESSIASAALLHLSAALPHVRWGVSPSHLSLANDIVQTPIQTINGFLHVPNGVGLADRS